MNSDGMSYDDLNHIYYWNGVKVPGVSEAIRDCGWVNFDGVDPEVLRRKAELGTAVHLACELFDKDELDEASIDPVILPYFEAYKKFKSESAFTPRLIEHRMVARIPHADPKAIPLRYGMTLDREGMLADKYVILDIKTACEIERWVGVQLHLYEWGARQAPCPIRRNEDYGHVALQLKKDGSYKLHLFDDVRFYRWAAEVVDLWYAKHETALKDENERYVWGEEVAA